MTDSIEVIAATEGPLVLPHPKAPLAVARRFVADRYTAADGFELIRAWHGGLYTFDDTCWPERDEKAVRAELYGYLEHAVYEVETNQGVELRPWDPTRAKVANVLEALRAATHLDAAVQPPVWLEGEGRPDARELVVMANGILHVPSR